MQTLQWSAVGASGGRHLASTRVEQDSAGWYATSTPWSAHCPRLQESTGCIRPLAPSMGAEVPAASSVVLLQTAQGQFLGMLTSTNSQVQTRTVCKAYTCQGTKPQARSYMGLATLVMIACSQGVLLSRATLCVRIVVSTVAATPVDAHAS